MPFENCNYCNYFLSIPIVQIKLDSYFDLFADQLTQILSVFWTIHKIVQIFLNDSFYDVFSFFSVEGFLWFKAVCWSKFQCWLLGRRLYMVQSLRTTKLTVFVWPRFVSLILVLLLVIVDLLDWRSFFGDYTEKESSLSVIMIPTSCY